MIKISKQELDKRFQYFVGTIIGRKSVKHKIRPLSPFISNILALGIIATIKSKYIEVLQNGVL